MSKSDLRSTPLTLVRPGYANSGLAICGVAGTGILTLQPAHTSRIEPRWPVALVVVGGCLLLALLPGRLRVFPSWVPYVVTAVFLVSMAALAITTAKGPWLRIETTVTVVVVLLAGFGIIDQLMHLLSEMVPVIPSDSDFSQCLCGLQAHSQLPVQFL